ncbi:MAG: hypothetical protein GF384_05910, partial [Elusimicrobia bacterium]|nr:hypothetical protein [Elusimicrobiota bacterium]MBD3412287.1 hypothetical protein [Elusimicrobiota bacterium]
MDRWLCKRNRRLIIKSIAATLAIVHFYMSTAGSVDWTSALNASKDTITAPSSTESILERVTHDLNFKQSVAPEPVLPASDEPDFNIVFPETTQSGGAAVQTLNPRKISTKANVLETLQAIDREVIRLFNAYTNNPSVHSTALSEGLTLLLDHPDISREQEIQVQAIIQFINRTWQETKSEEAVRQQIRRLQTSVLDPFIQDNQALQQLKDEQSHRQLFVEHEQRQRKIRLAVASEALRSGVVTFERYRKLIRDRYAGSELDISDKTLEEDLKALVASNPVEIKSTAVVLKDSSTTLYWKIANKDLLVKFLLEHILLNLTDSLTPAQFKQVIEREIIIDDQTRSQNGLDLSVKDYQSFLRSFHQTNNMFRNNGTVRMLRRIHNGPVYDQYTLKPAIIALPQQTDPETLTKEQITKSRFFKDFIRYTLFGTILSIPASIAIGLVAGFSPILFIITGVFCAFIGSWQAFKWLRKTTIDRAKDPENPDAEPPYYEQTNNQGRKRLLSTKASSIDRRELHLALIDENNTKPSRTRLSDREIIEYRNLLLSITALTGQNMNQLRSSVAGGDLTSLSLNQWKQIKLELQELAYKTVYAPAVDRINNRDDLKTKIKATKNIAADWNSLSWGERLKTYGIGSFMYISVYMFYNLLYSFFFNYFQKRIGFYWMGRHHEQWLDSKSASDFIFSQTQNLLATESVFNEFPDNPALDSLKQAHQDLINASYTPWHKSGILDEENIHQGMFRFLILGRFFQTPNAKRAQRFNQARQAYRNRLEEYKSSLNKEFLNARESQFEALEALGTRVSYKKPSLAYRNPLAGSIARGLRRFAQFSLLAGAAEFVVKRGKLAIFSRISHWMISSWTLTLMPMGFAWLPVIAILTGILVITMLSVRDKTIDRSLGNTIGIAVFSVLMLSMLGAVAFPGLNLLTIGIELIHVPIINTALSISTGSFLSSGLLALFLYYPKMATQVKNELLVSRFHAHDLAKILGWDEERARQSVRLLRPTSNSFKGIQAYLDHCEFIRDQIKASDGSEKTLALILALMMRNLKLGLYNLDKKEKQTINTRIIKLESTIDKSSVTQAHNDLSEQGYYDINANQEVRTIYSKAWKQTLVSKKFWFQWASTTFMLWFVNVEIAAFISYAGGIDSIIQSITGSDIEIVKAIAHTIEGRHTITDQTGSVVDVGLLGMVSSVIDWGLVEAGSVIGITGDHGAAHPGLDHTGLGIQEDQPFHWVIDFREREIQHLETQITKGIDPDSRNSLRLQELYAQKALESHKQSVALKTAIAEKLEQDNQDWLPEYADRIEKGEMADAQKLPASRFETLIAFLSLKWEIANALSQTELAHNMQDLVRKAIDPEKTLTQLDKIKKAAAADMRKDSMARALSLAALTTKQNQEDQTRVQTTQEKPSEDQEEPQENQQTLELKIQKLRKEIEGLNIMRAGFQNYINEINKQKQELEEELNKLFIQMEIPVEHIQPSLAQKEIKPYYEYFNKNAIDEGIFKGFIYSYYGDETSSFFRHGAVAYDQALISIGNLNNARVILDSLWENRQSPDFTNNFDPSGLFFNNFRISGREMPRWYDTWDFNSHANQSAW